MKRRDFVKNASLAGIGGLLFPHYLKAGAFNLPEKGGELLYNGIKLPSVWPPRNMSMQDYKPMPVPYLSSPPEIIPIDVGRQLFVDDFLIEKTTLKRKFYNAKKIDMNPVLKPETALEKGELPATCPKDGGVWWDAKDQLFKMWYEAGWLGSMAYATSKDGLSWDRPELDLVKGTNKIVPELAPDSTTVFIDYDTNNPAERFKMFWRGRGRAKPGFVMVSADGIHWSKPVKTDICGDRSTMFYNPFRKKWVFSIRSENVLKSIHQFTGRSRFYREHSDFIKGGDWGDEVVFWQGADYLDKPDENIGDKAQLYNLSAVGYESLMLGLHEIHLGPSNRIGEKTGEPKITELKVSFSRDGFHWDRSNRDTFIEATRKAGDWDMGYVQSVGGICTVVGDELRFYYTGFRGNQDLKEGKERMYSNGSTGIAVLRRDGFASMEAKKKGELTTRLLTFTGKYLFVNVDCPKGELKVEILDENDNVLSSYTKSNCKPLSVNSTLQMVEWKNVEDLESLRNKKIKFRFFLNKGKLYSFWVSPDKSGASYGYVAAGGPGFATNLDTNGKESYQKASNYKKLMSI